MNTYETVLLTATAFAIGGVLGWAIQGFEVDKLRAWKKNAEEQIKTSIAELHAARSMQIAYQEKTFHLARTIKELEQRLAKFTPNRPRDENGKFLKSN